MSHLHNCVLLFTGSTDTAIHAQASPASRQHLCHAYEMNCYTQPNTCVATRVNKWACRYKTPVLVEKFLPLWWVIVNVLHHSHYSTSLHTVSNSQVSKCCGSLEVRVWHLAVLYCSLLRQINVESRTSGGLRCLERLDKSVRSTCVHKEGHKGYWGHKTGHTVGAHTHIFRLSTSWFPAEWPTSFVYWAMFVIGLYLEYNLFKGFPQPKQTPTKCRRVCDIQCIHAHNNKHIH